MANSPVRFLQSVVWSSAKRTSRSCRQQLEVYMVGKMGHLRSLQR